MKKLLFSIVSLMASLSAFAEYSMENAYWIIKDGKLTDNIAQIMEYDPNDLGEKIPNELKDTVVDGENLVVYKQISKDFLDVRLILDEKNQLDLSTNYVLMLEYKIPESHTGTKIYVKEGNKPLWMFGFATSQSLLKNNNVTHAEAYSFIDAKWGEADKWITTYKYIYSPSTLGKIFGMHFTYAREYTDGDLTEFPYVKNLALISLKEGKPFYAENFDGYGLGEFYNEKNDISGPEGTGKKVSYVGGINPVLTEKDVEYYMDEGMAALTAFRDFLPDSIKDQDGSGYIDDEILHALQVETGRDAITFPGIQIPDGADKIFSQMIIKKHKNEKKLWQDASYDEFSVADLPIKLKFDNGDVIDLAKDTIKMIWTKFESEVNVPAGAKSFDLIFESGLAGYLVDEIQFSANKPSDAVNQFDANSFDIVAYVDENGDIVVLNGELVAAFNMEGRKASKEDKAVVIIVKNDEGQIASKVVVRK